MHILAVSKSALQSEWNWFCSHKARSRVDNDGLKDLVTAANLALMCSFEVIRDWREVLAPRLLGGGEFPEYFFRYIEVMLIDVRIRRQEPVVDRVRMEQVARGRAAGLQLLPFIDKNIPSERDPSPPMSSILVPAFERGHEVSNYPDVEPNQRRPGKEKG